jgi:hypothetical protein
MPTNKISAVLPEADKTAIVSAIDTIKTKMPFLVNLTNDGRKKLRKMGPSSVEFVTLSLQGAKNFGNLLRSDFNVNEFEQDVNLVKQLSEIRIKLAAVLESIEDTIIAAGSDAMASADTVYDYLKKGKEDSSVKNLLSQMGKKYDSQSKPRKSKETAK